MPKVVDVDQRRREVAAAAARVIARDGIDGASMRAVASEGGWTTGMLAHYFSNKRELLAFTLESSLDRRRSDVASAAGSGAEAIRSTLLEALPITEDNRLHWVVALTFAAQAASDPDLAEMQRLAHRSWRASLRGLILQLPDRTAEDVAATCEAERMIALVDGIALQALVDPGGWPAEKQIGALDAGLARHVRHDPAVTWATDVSEPRVRSEN